MARENPATDTPRKRPYVWPSWVSKVLGGDTKCTYQAWFKAHYVYRKTANDSCDNCANSKVPCLDPDTCRADFFAQYTKAHDAMVVERAERLQEDGWTVRTEDEAAFRLQGQLGDLSGKPDIVAMRGDEVVVYDAKSGNPRDSDHWQVLLYILALPLTWLKGFKTLHGKVEYRHGTVPVRSLGDKERERILAVLREAMGPTPPAPKPSIRDCRYCDIASCDARAQDGPRNGDAGGMF